MKLTARISSVLTALLALGCFFGTYKGLSALPGIADPAMLKDAKGFAIFWAFLGVVFLGISVLSWKSMPADRE